MKYTLLYTATLNFGDYLYFNKAKEIIKNQKKLNENDFLILFGKNSLDSSIDKINKTNALIICGGPCLLTNMYPLKYPLVKNLDDIKVPIILFGVGWYGVPGDKISLNEYSFSSKTLKLLNKINSQNTPISVRDYESAIVLNKYNFKNINVTGCPALFPDSINKLAKQKKIVFTAPANDLLFPISIKILSLLKSKFDNYEIVVSFHRGFINSKNEKKLIEFSKINNIKILNLEGSESFTLEIYDKFKFHIGFRVHAHLLCISRKIPSFLIAEDGRGVGVLNFLNQKKIIGVKRSLLDKFLRFIKLNMVSRKLMYHQLTLKVNNNLINEIVDEIEHLDLDHKNEKMDVFLELYKKNILKFVDQIP